MSRKFWIIILISLINSLSLTILIPVIYVYGKKFGLNDLQTSFLFSIYSLAQFFATPIIGSLSDRHGRKPLLIISLAGTVIANIMAGTTSSAGILFFARFLDGITGGNVSVAQAVLADVTTPENRTKAFGINGAAFGFGFVLGPVISLLAAKNSLGTSFIVSGLIALIALLITIFSLPETLSVENRKHQKILNWDSFNLLKGFFIPKIGILLFINFCIGTTFTIFTYGFQPYFLEALHQSNEALILMFLLFGVVGIIMQTGGLILLNRKLTLVQILFLGILMRSLSFVLMPIWVNVIYFVSVTIIFSLFNSFVQPAVNSLISLNTKPENQGMAFGLNISYLSAANAIGPVIAGLLIVQSNPLSFGYPLYLSGILTFLVLGLAFVTRDQYGKV